MIHNIKKKNLWTNNTWIMQVSIFTSLGVSSNYGNPDYTSKIHCWKLICVSASCLTH